MAVKQSFAQVAQANYTPVEQYEHVAIDLKDLHYEIVDNKLVLRVPIKQEILWNDLLETCHANGLNDQQADYVIEQAAAALNKQLVVNLLSNRV